MALEYASEYDIKFNPSKCQFTNIEEKGSHLGHIIGPNVSHDVFQDASFTLIHCVNSVLSNFRHCFYGVKYQLFR